MEQQPSNPSQEVHQKPPATLPLDSSRLLEGRDEVLIAHGGETYRLRRTRQGKLILTK